MSLRSIMDAGLLVSLLIGTFAVVANIIVFTPLRRRRAPIQLSTSGAPTYLLCLCRELSPSPDNDRLVRLAKWSVIAFLVAMIGAGISGPMLASLEQPCEAKPNGYKG
jgi:hypothetical protein